jgi:hypothetical protein
MGLKLVGVARGDRPHRHADYHTTIAHRVRDTQYDSGSKERHFPKSIQAVLEHFVA